MSPSSSVSSSASSALPASIADMLHLMTQPSGVLAVAGAAAALGVFVGIVSAAASGTAALLAPSSSTLSLLAADVLNATATAATAATTAAHGDPSASPVTASAHAGADTISRGVLSQLGLGSLDFTSGSLLVMIMGSIAAFFSSVRDYVWNLVSGAYLVTAEIESDDESYLWVLSYLAEHKISKQSRHFTVATSFASIMTNSGSYDDDYDESRDNTDNHNRKTLQYLPAPGQHMLFFQGQLLWLSRVKSTSRSTLASSKESMTIQSYGYSRKLIEDFLAETQERFLAKDFNKTIIYSVGYYRDNWSRVCSKPIRRPETLILEDGMLESVLDDAREFIESEAWYVDRGIPYRRGYLLHGPPGVGKSSFVAVVAGALKLGIYSLSLNGMSMDDTRLSEVLRCVPKRCVLLLEDIDSLFPKRKLPGASPAKKSEATTSTDATDEDADAETAEKKDEFTNGRVTFSGLLNALDGVGASVGRLLFVTTNAVDKLDAALIRPGRIDVKLYMGYATRKQAERLFCHFFGGSRLTSSVQITDATEPEDPELVERGKTIKALAVQFSELVPDQAFSSAQINGFLIRYKNSPEKAVEKTAEWVQTELASIDTLSTKAA